jgi:tetratricopeptide (TPR) repeat protein
VESVIQWAKAKAHESAGDLAEASRRFDAVRKQDPANFCAAMDAAWAHFRLKQFDDAARIYAEVGGSRKPAAMTWSAHAKACSGDYAGAARDYQARAAVPPLFYGEWMAPGAETAEVAVLYWRRALKDDPNNAVPHYMLGCCLQALGRTAEASKALRSALAHDPAFVPAALTLSALERGTDDRDHLDRLKYLLQADADHFGLLWEIAQLTEITGTPQEIEEAWTKAMDRGGDHVTDGDAVRIAKIARHKGIESLGVRALNHAMLHTSVYSRAVLGDDDSDTIRSALPNLESADRRVLAQYGIASGVFGLVSEAQGADNFLQSMMVRERLQAFGLVSSEQIKAATEAAFPKGDDLAAILNIGENMAEMNRASLRPFTVFAREQLHQVLEARPDFYAARVLLAQILWSEGLKAEATAELNSVLASDPSATSVRARLIDWAPLDLADALVSSCPPGSANDIRIAFRRARVLLQAGDNDGCIRQCVDTTRHHGSYWDVLELLGIALAGKNADEAAAIVLDHTFPLGRSSQGAVARAKLLLKLARDDAQTAAIDAWRIAPKGSTEESEALSLCRAQSMARFGCPKCGGGGTISVTNVSGSTYISSSTEQATCPQCLGLGLWHHAAIN